MSVPVSSVIIEPIVTEKTVAQAGKYTFRVHVDATKQDMKGAVKEFYGVEVDNINVIPVREKTRMLGRGKTMTKRRTGKKMTITLKGDETLNYNDLK